VTNYQFSTYFKSFFSIIMLDICLKKGIIRHFKRKLIPVVSQEQRFGKHFGECCDSYSCFVGCIGKDLHEPVS